MLEVQEADADQHSTLIVPIHLLHYIFISILSSPLQNTRSIYRHAMSKVILKRKPIMGFCIGQDFLLSSSWHFILKCYRYYYKMRQLFYYKMGLKFIMETRQVKPKYGSVIAICESS